MTTTIKKLPAILLAVIIAAALALGLGMTQQAVYAADGSNDTYISVWPEGYDFEALPGASINLFTTLEQNESANPMEVIGLQYQWDIKEGNEYVESITPDSNDPSRAVVKFKDLPEGIHEAQIAAQVTLLAGGQEISSDWTYLYVDDDFYRLEAGYIEPYMVAKFQDQVDAKVMHYTVADPAGVLVNDVTYQWKYDKNIISIKDNSTGKEVGDDPVKGSKVSFTAERLTGDRLDFDLYANWEDESGEQIQAEWYYLAPMSYDLSQASIKIDNQQDYIDYIINEGSTFNYKPQTGVYFGDTPLAGDFYDLSVEKYAGYNEETGEAIWNEYTKNDLELDPKTKDGKTNVDQDGNPIGGTAIYRIKATGKAGTAYEGTSTGEDTGYLVLYSDKTVNYWAADVDFGKYEFTPEEAAAGPTATVTLYIGSNRDPLKLTASDYKLTYINANTHEASATFPTACGEYQVLIEGEGQYYGKSAATAFEIGQANPMTAKGKSVKVKKNKKTTIKANKAFNVKNAKGQVSYWQITDHKKITVAENGKVTVKKGLKKGTYKIEVLVYDDGGDEYLSKWETVTLVVKAK